MNQYFPGETYVKKVTISMVVCAFTSTLSFASPLFLFSKHKKVSKKKIHHQVEKIKSDQPGVNFSGKWQGTCGETPLSLTIDQQGEWLFVETEIEGETLNVEVQIGGLDTHSKSDDYSHAIDHVFAFWNPNGKGIVIDTVTIEKSASAYAIMSSYTGTSRTSLELQDNQLILQGTSHSVEDGEAFGPERETCVFSKIENK